MQLARKLIIYLFIEKVMLAGLDEGRMRMSKCSTNTLLLMSFTWRDLLIMIVD